MSLVQLAYVIAFRRIMSNWRLEITLLLGIVLAVALMSSGVVFSDLLAEAALRRALNDATGEEANFSTRVFYGLDHPVVVPKQDSVYQRNLNFVEQTVENPFQPYLRDQALLVETSTFFFRGHPHLELDDDARPRGKLTHMTGLLPDHVRVVEGRWPYSAGGGLFPTGEPLEVAIDTMGARLLKLGVGDEMTVYPAVGEPDQPHTTVKIVALLERDNPADEFWYGVSRTFSSTEHTYDWVPLFTTENAIIDRVARTYPTLYTDVSWFYYLDRHGVRASDVGSIQKAIRNAKYNVRAYLENSSIAIKLDRVLDDYEEQLLLARIPLFLMLFMVTGILIYYLALVAGLIVRSRSTEISMLKSRGSTTFQVGLLAIVEGLLLAIPAIALGPLLALGVSRLLGRVFFDVGAGGELVPIELSSRAFLLGSLQGRSWQWLCFSSPPWWRRGMASLNCARRVRDPRERQLFTDIIWT